MYDDELWKDVIGHENDYMISNYGRLYNKHTGIIKYPIDLNSEGYPRHNMYYGPLDRQLAHRMVAIHFIDNPYNLPIVNHKDCNKMNSYYGNLEWCTYSENTNYYMRNKDKSNTKSTKYDNIPRKNITPLVAIYDDGSIEYFDSITKAANNDDTTRVYIQRHLGVKTNRFNCVYYINPANIVC